MAKTTSKTPLVRFVGRLADKMRGTFYEGPEVPERFALVVAAFAEEHPRATRGEWLEFAQLHAAQAYQSGYMRGLEWTERDLERGIKAVDPDQVAEEMAHGFEWEPPATSLDLLLEEVVLDQVGAPPVHFTDADEAAAHFAAEEARQREPRQRVVQGPRRR